MFRRKVINSIVENYGPVTRQDNGVLDVHITGSDLPRNNIPVQSKHRSELFVLAANIYTRARTNTRSRAAGII